MRVVNTPLKPEDYFPRLLDRALPSLLNSYKILEFEGANGCGKTYLCLSVAQTITHADEKSIVLPLIQSDPRLALAGARPHVIDEWGVMPELQEISYREAESAGSILMTTSLRPKTIEPYVRSHASEAARIRLRTLSLEELGLSDRSVPLASLLGRRFHPTVSGAPVAQIATYICKGGWPGAGKLDAEESLAWTRAHLECLFAEYVPVLGKKTATAKAVLASLATCGGDFTYDRVAARMQESGQKPPSRNTLAAYVSMLERLYLLERLDGWAAPVRATSRLKVKPRYYACDPSLVTAAKGADEHALLSNAELFSRALKTMALRDLLVYASALKPGHEPRVCYYADSDGLEIDFVALFEDNQWALINVEIGEAQVKDSVKRLERLKKKIRNAEKLGEPLFSAVVLAATDRPRQDPATGTYIFPITSFSA